MTEQKDPKETTAEASSAPETKGEKATPKKRSSPRTKKRKSGSGTGLAILALIVAVAGVAASYYLWKLQLITEQQLIQQRQDHIAELKQQLTASEQQLQSALRQSERNSTELSANLQELEQNLIVIRGEIGKSSDDWSIAEVEYLLTIANRILLLTRDIDTAITALEMANQRLASQADPALLPVRKQVTAEIQSLKGIKQPDTEAISLQLSVLIGVTDQLPIEGTIAPTPARAFEKSGATEGDGLKAAGNTLLQALKSLVVIRHDADNTQPLMAPEQRYFLRHNLQLKLESARLALLSGNSSLYRSLLNETGEWIKRYFDNQAGSVASALQEIEQLALVDIAPPLPDISSSLRIVRELKRRYPASQTTGPAMP